LEDGISSQQKRL